MSEPTLVWHAVRIARMAIVALVGFLLAGNAFVLGMRSGLSGPGNGPVIGLLAALALGVVVGAGIGWVSLLPEATPCANTRWPAQVAYLVTWFLLLVGGLAVLWNVLGFVGCAIRTTPFLAVPPGGGLEPLAGAAAQNVSTTELVARGLALAVGVVFFILGLGVRLALRWTLMKQRNRATN